MLAIFCKKTLTPVNENRNLDRKLNRPEKRFEFVSYMCYFFKLRIASTARSYEEGLDREHSSLLQRG